VEIVFSFLLINLVLWVCLSVYLVINTRKISLLKNEIFTAQEPSLAIVIAVRDEEDQLREALRSVCKLNYTSLEIIVVDDRSTDQTASILEELSIIYPQLVLERITSLPPLWLGKTHALYRGALKTTSDWILFTDADIIFDPDAVKKAMGYALNHKLDHLTILPEVKSRSQLFNSVLATFQIMLEIKLRPWLANNPKSKASIGVGAFNLIKKTAYQQIGTHKSIKLRPDDDLQLGKAIKEAGLKQDVLYGQGEVSLEWYPSIREFINGLMKNTFSAFDYQIFKALSAALGAFLLFALPIPLGLLSGDLKTQLITFVIIVVQFGLYFTRNGNDTKWWYSLTISYAGLLMTYITLKATFLTLKNKGIFWRGTFYSLKELRKHS
jgi:glycosyltransferase involved in cell wall biosynthesis